MSSSELLTSGKPAIRGVEVLSQVQALCLFIDEGDEHSGWSKPPRTVVVVAMFGQTKRTEMIGF